MLAPPIYKKHIQKKNHQFIREWLPAYLKFSVQKEKKKEKKSLDKEI